MLLHFNHSSVDISLDFKFFQVLSSYAPCGLFAVSSLYSSLRRIASSDVLVCELLLSNV
nr:MAG TPA: hypothetical protein [Caudoviricetes sp.]DAX87804.1 MAG TPA: hypothetical protein [Caudoviricetes sp.]